MSVKFKGKRKRWWGVVASIKWEDVVDFVATTCLELTKRPDLENFEKWKIAVDATIEYLDTEIEFTGVIGRLLDLIDGVALHAIAAIVVPIVYHGIVKKGN